MSSKRKGVLGRIPGLRELREIRESLARIESGITAQTALLQHQFLAWQLLANPRYQDPRRLNRHEHQVYSQNGEDGVIAEVFRRIGARSRTFLEIGVGDGLENNTTHLLLQGWSGCWLEADPRAVARVQSTFAPQLASGQLKLEPVMVTAENVSGTLAELGASREPDLLSIDVDRNTWHIWAALPHVKARLVVVEYNALYPAADSWKVNYEPRKTWNGTARFGASLKAYEELGRKLGYALVGCEFFGANAFFVRADLAGELFCAPFTAENHYEPPRYWLARRDGHRRCITD
jgi:hypothetical protein